MNNRTTELESLSKLKMAGRLRFWRGTIEIPEDELHAICDEIQAEHDRAVAALNKAAGNWAKADALLRERTSGTLTAEQVEIAINNHCQFTVGCVVDAQAIADELNALAERTCCIIEYDEAPYPVCSECGAVQPDDYTVYFCWSCGAKVRNA